MHLARIFAAILLISLTFGAGLQVDRGHLKETLRNTSLLVRVLLANFVVVPALGVLLARLFALPDAIATGFLLMAIAPGVPLVLSQVRKRGGSLGLAVEMAIVLPLISIVTVPLYATFVLPAGAGIDLPFGRFLTTMLLFQLLPLLLGMLVGERAPAFAERLGRPLQLVFLLSALAVVVVLAPMVAHSVAEIYGSHAMWATLCLVLLSLGTGWLLGGPERSTRRILAIGTGLRNIGLCSLIATTNFQNAEVTAAVITYLLFQAVIVSLFGVYFTKTAARATA
ncbi:MAG TPA: bile acid:sodium symporter [Candidatus Cybelea sp.]|jgi:BASS family bile acid:Na+ symporter|nr:bile acid:sodium symporter [Candidatus Cybelea sp.]